MPIIRGTPGESTHDLRSKFSQRAGSAAGHTGDPRLRSQFFINRAFAPALAQAGARARGIGTGTLNRLRGAYRSRGIPSAGIAAANQQAALSESEAFQRLSSPLLQARAGALFQGLEGQAERTNQRKLAEIRRKAMLEAAEAGRSNPLGSLVGGVAGSILGPIGSAAGERIGSALF
jgi:hypothetical protein